MYVKVIYFKPLANAYAGRDYTYKTNLPLSIGDKVIAPTAKEPEQKAMVIDIDVPEEEISPEWIDRIKEIRGYAE